jgi:predicted dehydrogenase
MQNLAILGAGNFSTFTLPQFLKNDKVAYIGIFDTDPVKARNFQSTFGGTVFQDFDAVLNNPEITMVYIATPPWQHFPNAEACLMAGKHVICEKPAALRLSEVEKLIELAKDENLLYVVNLMQRYNPLYQIVSRIIEQKILGEFLHGFFENYASDENSPPSHWFWDEKKSGGIFIEHAVHFFDMFEGWFGKGALLSSIEIQRKNTAIENLAADRAQAVIQYDAGIVNMYHGFDQPDKMDRQEIRLLFERGNINLYEWVPTSIQIEALITKETLVQLKNMLPGSEIMILETYHGTRTRMKGRLKDIVADFKIKLKHTIGSKSNIYQDLLAAMIEDQLLWLEDKNRKRLITEKNAYNSLKMAVDAHEAASIMKL